MTQDRFTYLFSKQLEGTCSDQEQMEFNALLNSGKYDNVASRLMDEHWALSKEADMNPGKSKSILENVFANTQTLHSRKRVFKTSTRIGLAAAAVFLLISSGILYQAVRTNSNEVKVKQIASRATPAVAGKFVTTAEHRKVTLPDGSTVILNKYSTLSLSGDFNNDKREVLLVGEGYFDIVHDTRKPFIVTSGEVRTTVLGTAFNVKAYRASKVEVTVTRGKVSVLSGRNIIAILTPNRQLVVPHQVSKPVISTVVAKNVIRWQEKDLFFDNISFAEATLILSKKFNTPITFVNDKAKQCHFTATFLQGETLDEVLKVICSFNNANYHKTAAGISIDGPGCSS